MRNFKSLYKISGAVAIVSGGLAISHIMNQQELKASWTNSYEPSVKWDYNWDRRDPSSLIKNRHHKPNSSKDDQKLPGSNGNTNNDGTPKKTVDDFEIGKHSSKASRHLFLIRHGQYEIKAPLAEQMVLTQLGREQAQFTGKRLNDIGAKYKFTHLYHSTMVRAVETADIIRKELSVAETLPVKVDPLLCEGAPIPPEPPVGHWRPELHFFSDGSRIEAAFRKYFHRAPPDQLEDSVEIIVCHANVIRYFFCRALQFPAEAWLRFDLPHGSITHIVIRPDGRVGCRCLGESGFQPIQKVSS